MKQKLYSLFLLALLGIMGTTAWAQTPEPTAKWTFEDTSDLMAPSVGSLSLTPALVGNHSISPSTVTDAGIVTADGPAADNKAIAVPKAAALKVARAAGAETSTAYTIMMDIKVPNAQPFNGLLQMDEANNNDGDLFTNKGQVGIGSLAYAGKFKDDTWNRVVFTYDESAPVGKQAKVFLNGAKVAYGGTNVRHIMEPFGFYVLCDEDGEKIDLTYISELAFWETPLTDEQVYAMGNLFPTTEIGSLSDLNDFTQAVNSGQDVNGKLTADINIGTWTTPIGTSENTFAGIFDGQGHSITGFSATSEIDGGGLFGQTNGALIKDFSIYGTLTSTAGTGSGVVGYPSSSVITGIHSYLDIDVPVGGVHHVGGVVGSARGRNTIKGCTFHGTMQVTTGNNDNFAGIVAYLGGDDVTFCANYGDINFDDAGCTAGGVAGYLNNTASFVQGCLNMGSVALNDPEGTPNLGGAILGWLRSGDVSRLTGNCWLAGSATGAGKSGGNENLTTAFRFKEEQLPTGEVCYNLNGDQSIIGWYQTLPGDDAPVLLDPTHAQVYKNGILHCNGDPGEGTNFSNENLGTTQEDHNEVDGFCNYCGLYYPDALTPNADGYYEITNATRLAWFERKVNTGTFNANAILTADIDFADLLKEGETEVDWTPIGDWGNTRGVSGACYQGHFDGQGHAIKNFNATQKQNFFGLFGVISSNCVIENFDLDGTLNFRYQYAGSVAAYARDINPTIRNIHSSVNINNTSEGGRQGGILGTTQVNDARYKTVIEGCTYSGTFDGNDAGGSGNYGGMVGYANSNANNITEITNCLFDGWIFNGNASPGGCTFGGMVGYCNTGTTIIKNCLSYGSVSAAEGKFGQFFGALNGNNSTFTNCYYTGDDSFINGGTSGGHASGEEPVNVEIGPLSSGEICWKLNEETFIDAVWHQVLGEQNYPVPYGDQGVVYETRTGNYENIDLDPDAFASFLSDIIDKETEFIEDEDLVAYQEFIDEYKADIESWNNIGTLEEFLETYKAAAELKEAIIASAAKYAAYKQACEDAAAYIDEHHLAGEATDALITYLEDATIEAGDENYPNGSYPYIWENRNLDDAGIDAEIAFVTSMLDAAIASGGIVSGVDVSRFFINPSFADGFEGWTTENDEGVKVETGGNPEVMPLVHGYGKGAFSVSQTVTGLPDGIYMTKTNALFSANDDPQLSFYAGQVFINNTVNYVMAPGEDLLPEDQAVDGVNCLLSQDKIYEGEFGRGYVPNTRVACSYAFNSGRYKNYCAAEVTGGTLTVGVRGLGTGLANDWLPFNDMHIIYLGTAEEADDSLTNILSGYCDRAQVILNFPWDQNDYTKYPNMSEELKSRLEGALVEAEAPEDKMALINDFSDIFNNVFACRKAYIAMIDAAYQLSDVLDILDGMELVSEEDYEYWNGKILEAQNHYSEGDVSTEEALAIAEVLNNCDLTISPVDGVYQLANAKNLLLFEMLVNKGEFTANAVLTADIDMADLQKEDEEEIDWTPIGDWGVTRGTGNAGYQGHFDGQGHTIKNLNATSKQNWFGLFGVISSNCIIENFDIYGTYNINFQYAGGVAAYARDINPTIRNVHSYVNINNTYAGGRQGGILGGAHVDNANYRTTVANCTYSGTLDGNDAGGGGNYGGIVGYCDNNANNIVDITNCLFDGEVVNNNATPGNCTFGGIVGYNNGARATIKNCLSIGTVRSTRFAQFFGALNGNNSTFVNNYYVGDNVNGSGSAGTAAGDAPTKVTDTQLKSGEICYKLNGDQSEINWYQSINVDAYPVLDPEHETVLFNEEENLYYNLVNGIPVGINEIVSSEPKVQNSIYNLAGQRLEKFQKGINIVNGKKVLVK